MSALGEPFNLDRVQGVIKDVLRGVPLTAAEGSHRLEAQPLESHKP